MVVYIISTADGIKFDVPMLYGTLTRYLGTSKGIQCVIHVIEHKNPDRVPIAQLITDRHLAKDERAKVKELLENAERMYTIKAALEDLGL